VHQREEHLGAEHSLLRREPRRAEPVREAPVEDLGPGRRSRLHEARTPAVTAVPIERELRDEEDLASHLRQREVHSPVSILEDPETEDLVREERHRLLVVFAADAEEDDHPRPDPARQFSLHGDLGLPNPLNYRSHLQTAIVASGLPRIQWIGGPCLQKPAGSAAPGSFCRIPAPEFEDPEWFKPWHGVSLWVGMQIGMEASQNGILAQIQKQDLIANNLANITTHGFKRSTQVQTTFPVPGTLVSATPTDFTQG